MSYDLFNNFFPEISFSAENSNQLHCPKLKDLDLLIDLKAYVYHVTFMLHDNYTT